MAPGRTVYTRRGGAQRNSSTKAKESLARRPPHAAAQHVATRSLSLLLGHTDGASLAAGGLRPLATHAQAPVVAQATVRTDLLQALEVLAQLHVERVGDDLRELAILGVLLAVEHPVGHLELPRVLHDGDEALHLLSGQLASALVQVDLGLLARDVGKAAANALDAGEGEHHVQEGR